MHVAHRPNGWTGEDWLASTCKTCPFSVSQVIGGQLIGVTHFYNKGEGRSSTLELDLILPLTLIGPELKH